MPDKPNQTPPPARHQQPQIDIAQLAEKVYQLMLAEVRIAKARGASITRRGRE